MRRARRSAMIDDRHDARDRRLDRAPRRRWLDLWLRRARARPDERRSPRRARVSNPGCYPTGFLALVRPLVRAGLVPRRLAAQRQRALGLFGRRQVDDRGVRGAVDDANTALRGLCARASRTSMCPRCRSTRGSSIRRSSSRGGRDTYRGMIVEVPLPLHALSRGVRRWQRSRTTLREAYKDSPLVRVLRRRRRDRSRSRTMPGRIG